VWSALAVIAGLSLMAGWSAGGGRCGRPPSGSDAIRITGETKSIGTGDEWLRRPDPVSAFDGARRGKM
jgi:hypothetical protein